MGPRACHYKNRVGENVQDYQIALSSLPEGTAARAKAGVQQGPSRGPG